MARILTTAISGSQCIGDSLGIINNNYEALDTVVYALSTNTILLSSTATTTPTLLTSPTSYPWQKRLAVDVNDGSITSAKLANGVSFTGNLTGNVVGVASQATTLVTASAGPAPVYGCRAWVNFDGTRDYLGASSTSNTNRYIRSSGNVSSVLRTGTGLYTITFITAMSDANYVVIGNSSQNTLSNNGQVVVFSINGTAGDIYQVPTTSSFKMQVCANSGSNSADYYSINLTVFGN
jgi:uncharacterized protein YaiE (UPF0345 family)